MRSVLLCIKRFCPSVRLTEDGTASDQHPASETLLAWVKAVFKQYGLSINKHLIGSVTDAGPDVCRLGSKLLGKVTVPIYY